MDDKAIKALVANSQLAVSVKDYGAKGDGVTDDTLAFNNALSAVSKGGKLIIPSGTYKINGPVSVLCTGDVEIEGQYGVTLDCTASKVVDGSSVIQIGGGVGTSYNLTGNVQKYRNLIPCAQAFNQGDMVQLISTDLWNPQRANYVKGEFCEVESTNAGKITTKGSIYDNYNAASTKVRKLIMPRVKMSNIVIKCNSFTIGLMLTTIKELHLEDVLVTGAKYSGISVTNIYGGLVKNCEATDCYSPANPTVASYGLVISSCQGLTVLGGHYLGGRHGISHGGTTPVRDIVIQGATIGNNSTTAETSLDAHGNMENIIVRDCRINNGMTLLALNAIVENNHIQVMAFTTGIQIVPEINAGTILVQNNTVINPNPNGSGIIIAVASSGIASIVIDKCYHQK
ncbi:MAG: hypothetical protein JWM44_3496 [Bacilli bacterium]|nr:hypothetical protein [Bacilli bacterium]